MEFAQKLAEVQALSENFISLVNKDLTNVKFKVLLFLNIYGVCTPKILIAKIGIIKTNLALTLKQLINDGCVSVSASTKDARSKEYCLTPKGENEVKKVYNNIENIISINDKLKDFDTALGEVLAVLNRKL